MNKRLYQRVGPLFWLLIFSTLTPTFAQLVTTTPAFPTADTAVTIIVDLTKATDGRAKGLLGKKDDVFLWSGAGSTETGQAFEFTPTGQKDFNAPFPPGAMTALGNDRWQIKLVPRVYYGVPASTPVKRLGMVIKSGDGKAQTEDFFVKIFDAKLTVSFARPTVKLLFVETNTDVLVRANASDKAALTLTVDGAVAATAVTADSVVTTVKSGATINTLRKVVITAKTATETASDSFLLYVKPTPTIAAVPAGLRDGINYSTTDPTSATLVLYAPLKTFVNVISEQNNWTPTPTSLMNRTADSVRYWLVIKGLTAGQELAFQYLIDGQIATGDPYGDKILDRNNDSFLTAYPNLKPFPTKAQGQTVSVLQTGQTAYPWKVASFTRPNAKNMVVYELLVRDFIASRQYAAVADSLPYLKKLGINAIELMPIMEFSGNDSWGYNPTFYFAPDKAYGTKNDLKAFIDKCHENGIAVILDMVLNQADYEFPYVKMYWDGSKPSANSPFFNPQATHPFSVFFDFNHESKATQNYVQRVNQYWLQEYKFDGYRFDLSKGFTQTPNPNNVNAWGAYDASRVAIWKRIYDEIRSYDKSAYMILEHFADNSEEKELANYGMLFWGNINYNFRYSARGATKTSDISTNWLSYKERGWNNPNVLGYMESHDEERLVYDVLQNGNASGTYNTKDPATALERAKLAAALFLPVPGPKLIWQFGELGYDVNIDFNGRTGAKPIKWEYARDANRAKLLRVYQELIKLKLTQPAFQSTDFVYQGATPVKSLTLNDATNPVVILGNFDAQANVVALSLPKAGMWYDYFSGQPIESGAALNLKPGQWHILTAIKLPTPETGIVPWFITPPAEPILATEPVPALTISPNPTADLATINWESTYRGPVTVSVSGTTGRALQTQVVEKTAQTLHHAVSLRTLPTGLYLIKVQTDGGVQVQKVLKE